MAAAQAGLPFHITILPSIRFFHLFVCKWISRSQWEAWHSHPFVPVSFEQITTVCVSNFAPSTPALVIAKKIKKQIRKGKFTNATFRRERIIHVEMRRRFPPLNVVNLFVVFGWVIDSIREEKKDFSIISRHCAQLEQIVRKADASGASGKLFFNKESNEKKLTVVDKTR